jgi:YbbR domain-containing protein
MVNVNVVDNTQTLTLDISVVGADILSGNENMMIYGMDQATVTVTVKGSNRELRKYTESDFSAFVNVREISDSGKHILPISVQLPTGASLSVVSTDILNVTLYSDLVATKTVPFDTFYGNAIMLPETEGYYNVVKSVDSVEITGPKQLVDSIESAKYCIEGDIQLGKSFSNCSLIFCDGNGDFVSDDMGLLSYSTEDITVDVLVTGKKTVPILVTVAGLEEGEYFATMSSDMVTLYGDPLVLAQIDEYTIGLDSVAIGQKVKVTLSDSDLREGISFGENEVSIYIQINSTADASQK